MFVHAKCVARLTFVQPAVNRQRGYRQELRSALKGHTQELIDDITGLETFTQAVDLALMGFVCGGLTGYILMLTGNFPMSFKDKMINNTFRFLEDNADKYEFLN